MKVGGLSGKMEMSSLPVQYYKPVLQPFRGFLSLSFLLHFPGV